MPFGLLSIPPFVRGQPAMAIRSRYWFLLLLGGLFLGGAATGAWWYWRNQPDQLLIRARAAIAREQWQDADDLAARLDSSRQPPLGKLVRGESLLAQERYAAALHELAPIRDEETLRVR